MIKMPKTSLGKWAVGFGVALVLLTTISLIFAAFIGGDPALVANSPLLSVLANILSIMFSLTGPLSFLLGIITVIKYKEWLVGKYLAGLYILSLLIFLMAEFIFPH